MAQTRGQAAGLRITPVCPGGLYIVTPGKYRLDKPEENRKHKDEMTMRKLKLQMHVSVDGFVATTANEPIFNWNDELRRFSIANLEEVDCIILGRKTAVGFIPHWASAVGNPNDPDFQIGKKLTDTPKVVFTKTLTKSEWANTTLAREEIVDEINKLKTQAGKGIMVYGGASFVSSLVKNGLIDEFYLAVNPVVVGSGLPIFNELNSRHNMTLIESKSFNCGVVLLHYVPQK